METQHSLYREQQLLFETLEVFVGWQLDPIEASMAPRQLRRIARLVDRESPRSIRALQILEPVDGYSRGARHELQQARFAF